jgi:hypothetical protein
MKSLQEDVGFGDIARAAAGMEIPGRYEIDVNSAF